MAESNYIQKKLEPLRKQEEKLIKDLQEVTEALRKEEEDNEKYFHELIDLERQIEAKTKEVQNLQKDVLAIQVKQQGTEMSSNTDLEQKLEEKVKDQLDVFLLRRSKKDMIEEKLENDLRREPKDQKDKDDYDAAQKFLENTNDIQYSVLVKKDKERASPIVIDADVKTFDKFRAKMGYFFGVDQKNIFITDRLGNLLMFHLNILDTLYPPVYALLKNYKPLIHIIIKRPIVEKNDNKQISFLQSQEATLLKRNEPVIRRKFKKREDDKGEPILEKIKRYTSTFKYFAENILFLVLVVMFAINNFDGTEFQERQSLYASIMSNFPINTNYKQPEISIKEMIQQTIPSDQLIKGNKTLFPTLPLRQSLLIQKVAVERPLDDCLIVQDVQKEALRNAQETCLDYDQEFKGDLKTKSNNLYNEKWGGYTWEFSTSSQKNLSDSWKLIQRQKWLTYRRSLVNIIVNFYNAPSNKLAVFTATSLVIQPEGALNFNTVDVKVLPLTQQSNQKKIVGNLLFAISLILSLFAAMDVFGIYSANTKEKIILHHKKIQLEEKLRQEKQKLKSTQGQKQTAEDDKPKVDTSGLLNDYYIFEFQKLYSIYFVIKKPTVYEYIFIVALALVTTHSQIESTYDAKIRTINLQSEEFFDPRELLGLHETVNILAAICILLIMMSAARFMGNWNTYLYAYGQTMVSFIKYTWFLIIVLGFMFSMLAVAWIINMQGQLLYHFNFTYVILGLIRSTLNYGIFNDTATYMGYQNLRESIIYQFQNQYIQYLCIVSVTFLMFPIFSAMLTKFVHDTKEELNMKLDVLGNKNAKGNQEQEQEPREH